MKEVKDCRLEFRLTQTEKEQIKEYAERHGMSMSEAIRDICIKIFNKERE